MPHDGVEFKPPWFAGVLRLLLASRPHQIPPCVYPADPMKKEKVERSISHCNELLSPDAFLRNCCDDRGSFASDLLTDCDVLRLFRALGEHCVGI